MPTHQLVNQGPAVKLVDFQVGLFTEDWYGGLGVAFKGGEYIWKLIGSTWSAMVPLPDFANLLVQPVALVPLPEEQPAPVESPEVAELRRKLAQAEKGRDCWKEAAERHHADTTAAESRVTSLAEENGRLRKKNAAQETRIRELVDKLDAEWAKRNEIGILCRRCGRAHFEGECSALTPAPSSPAQKPSAEASDSQDRNNWIAEGSVLFGPNSDGTGIAFDNPEDAAFIAKAVHEYTTEKIRRIYYQNIVYAVCRTLDRINGGKIVCGTVDTPTTHVQDAMKQLEKLATVYIPRRILEAPAVAQEEPKKVADGWKLLATYLAKSLAYTTGVINKLEILSESATEASNWTRLVDEIHEELRQLAHHCMGTDIGLWTEFGLNFVDGQWSPEPQNGYNNEEPKMRLLASPSPSPASVSDVPPASPVEQKIEQLVDERDKAEEAVSQAYYLVTGQSPEWSNQFGYPQALEGIADAFRLLKHAAKQAASPVASNAKTPAAIEAERQVVEAAKKLWRIVDQDDAGLFGQTVKVCNAVDALLALTSPAKGGA